MFHSTKCFRVFRSFGWKIFRYAGNNKQLIHAYRLYAIYAAMLKFDVLIVVGVLITNSFFLYFDVVEGYIAFGFLFFFSIILPTISLRIAIKKEIIILQILFLIWCLTLPAFLLYRVCYVPNEY